MKNKIPTAQTARTAQTAFAIIASMLIASASAPAQTTASPAPAPIIEGKAALEYDFVGTYKREAAQGMAIYKDTAFLFNNTGIVRIYNLKTREFISDFLLDTSAPENHSNCANFGVEFPEGNSSFPALYVSECYGQRRCFVENVNAAGAKLIQTLKIRIGGVEDSPFDWYVDKANNFLYAISISKSKAAGDHKATRDYLITKLRLPKISEGDITFTKKDFLDQFTISFRHLSQGGIIRGDYLYMPLGHPKPAKNDPRDRCLIVVNLRTKQIERELDLNKHLDVEPEDVDFHGDNLLMYCGQAGGLWRITGHE